MTEKEHSISIWFFVGVLFVAYGVLILGAGIYGCFVPPPVAMSHLHLGVWWGALLLGIGLFYSIHFRPSRPEADQSSPAETLHQHRSDS